METDDSKTLATEATKATETSTKSEPKTPLVSIYVLYSVAENVGFLWHFGCIIWRLLFILLLLNYV